MTHSDIVAPLERLAPIAYQESYDNTGWQVGFPSDECRGALLALDMTMDVLREAIDHNCNLIITHHPLIFSGIKSITGKNEIQKIIIEAIKNNIAIYACHTNVDNISKGVNAKIAAKLDLEKTSILLPSQNNLIKLVTYSPMDNYEEVRDALFAAGAGEIGEYRECSFVVEGKGTFKPSEDANPSIGQPGGVREEIEEKMISVLINAHDQNRILEALRAAHPYEEVAYEMYPLANTNQHVGAGMIGYLNEEKDINEFLSYLKEMLNVEVIRHTKDLRRKIRKVGICGGSGSFLLKNAIALDCDVFITGDFKYHQFFEAENKIVIMDIGHYESEQFTPEIFYDIIKNKFTNFAVRIAKTNTNPIKYYY